MTVTHLLLVTVVSADADILVPPGTTDEIISLFVPPSKVTPHDKIKTGGIQKEEKIQKGTQTYKHQKIILSPKSPPPINVNFDEMLGIAAADFDAEYPQLARTPLPFDSLVEGYNYKTNDYELIRGRCEVFFKCFSRLLMKLFHNNRLLEKEDIFYLTLFGDPAGNFPASHNTLKGWDSIMSSFCTRIRNFISEDNQKIILEKTDNPYDEMINKLVTLELVSYSPFSVSAPFAPGLDNFDIETIYAHTKKLLTHPSKRVRRNACYYLGIMQKYESMSDLLVILRTTDDNVMKARSLFFLTQAAFEGLEQHLIERLPNEKDEIFEIAIVNSLRKLRSKKAFPILIGKLINARADFDYLFCTLKACIACFDKNNKVAIKKFYEFCKDWDYELKNADEAKLKSLSDKFQTLIDPPAVDGQGQFSPQMLFKLARLQSFKVLLSMALGLCGDSTSLDEITSKIQNGLDCLTKFRGNTDDSISAYYEQRNNTQSGLGTFPSLIRIFLAEELPQFGSLGKSLLEKLLVVSGDHYYVLFAALQTYARTYPAEFANLVIDILNSEVPLSLKDKAVKTSYNTGTYNDKVRKELKKIVSTYSKDSSNADKHLVSIALFYLSIDKQLTDKVLIDIAVSEIDRPAEEPKFSQNLGLFYIKFPRVNHLLEISLELLGSVNTEKARKTLLKLSNINKDNQIKRIIAKALGNYKSDDAKKKLFDLLIDEDGWTRLISYLSLSRITLIDHKVDWFFANQDDLKIHTEQYRQKIEQQPTR
ncbi:MAG: HEAT repeat domain-containing protein [Planctomycetes bacterium]|nr:HEAT repeat domain-containing protein [Planctomycetota bacterium]